MMIKTLRDLLRSYWKEHASNQAKHQKSKLLIYDEYLNKYVGADELLIPGVKGKNKGAVTRTKELFVFDVLFKKFVNPKLDLLIPGINSLDLLLKHDSSNNKKYISTSSRDYFWGKKTTIKKNAVKKNAVCPLPPVHSKTNTETEPPQVGWAGQEIRKPQTDPRPELGKPECKLGPSKDPKKKKPPRKKSKNNKYLVCGKVKECKENVKDAEQTTKDTSKSSKDIANSKENNDSDLKEKRKQLKSQPSMNEVSKVPMKDNKDSEKGCKQTKNVTKKKSDLKINQSEALIFKQNIKESSRDSKEILFNEENCYADSKEYGKELESYNSIIDVSKHTLKSVVKEDVLLENSLKESGHSKTDKRGVFKVICSKLVLNEVNVKEQTLIQSISNPPNKLNACDQKACTSLKKNEKDKVKHESVLKSSQSKALVCKSYGPSSLIASDESKSTNLYLCKENKDKAKHQNKVGKTESVCSKQICPPGTASTNEIKCDKKALSNNAKKEKGGDNTNNTNTCFNKTNVDDCSKIQSMKDTDIDQIKCECKKAITKRPTTSPIETSDNSKAKEPKILSNTESECNKSKTSPYNFMAMPKTAYLKKPSSNANQPIHSGHPKTDCNSVKQNIIDENAKSEQRNEVPCICASAENTKVTGKRNETNDSDKHKPLENSASRCLNIDPKSTEKLHYIAQEELFKRADSSTDLTKCSSYLGFKVKKTGSKSKPATENTVKDQTNECKKIPPNEVGAKQKGQSKTNKKTTTSDDDSCGQSKQYCNSLRSTKVESCLNEEPTKQTLNSTSQDLDESKSKKVCDSDTKENLRDGKNKLSKKKSSTKTKKSKKCKSKSSIDIKADKSRPKKVGKRKNSTDTSKKEHKKDKSSRCTKYSDSSEYKDLKENVKYDTGKGEDKQVCCKKTEKDQGKNCCEKIQNPSDCQPTSDTKETTTDKSSIGDHESKEYQNKRKLNIKQVITGAKPRKKAIICTKIKPFLSLKSRGKTNEIDKTKLKNTSSKNVPKSGGEPVEIVKKVKSGKVCSEKKSSISADKTSRKSKSKHSQISKASNLEQSKDICKSQKGQSLTKLNKLVRKAKCSTAGGKRKEGAVTHALICSKSTPNKKHVKQNKISGPSKLNVAMPKERSALNSSDKKSRKGKCSKNETNSTKMGSLHTLHKRMPETPTKTSKRIDIKSFSELKMINNIPQRDISAELFNSCNNYSSQLNMLWNKQKTERENVKNFEITEEFKLGSTEHKMGRNCLKMLNYGKHELMIDPKNRKLSPYLKQGTNLQPFPVNPAHATVGNKHKSKDALKLVAKASKNDNVIPAVNSQAKMATKSLNNFKEYSNDRFKTRDVKNKSQKSSISIVSKDSTINVHKSRKTNNLIKITNNQNGCATQNSFTNKIMKKGFQERNTFNKLGTLTPNGNTNSLHKGPTNDTCFKEGFRKGEGSKIQPHKATVSKINSRDSSNTDNMKSANQTVRAMSAAATKRLNNALSVPPKTPSPWKSKSFSSFNALIDHDTDAKHTVRPLRSSKKETNEDFEIKNIDDKHSQDQENNIAEILYHPNKSSNKHLPIPKCENAANSLESKISPLCNVNSFNHDQLVPRKLPNLQEYQRKHMVEQTGNIGQTDGRRNHDSKKPSILCDFIEGSFDINVQNIEPQYLDDDTKSIINQYRTGNTTKKFIIAGKHNLKYNDRTKKEPRKYTRSTLRNKTLVIDELEQYVAKLETIVPSMKRIFKPIYLNSGVAIDDNGESKKMSAVKAPVKDKIPDKIISKGSETEYKAVNEMNNFWQKKRNVSDESACDRKIINVQNTVFTPNYSETLKEEAFEKCLNSTHRSDLQNDETKNDTLSKQERTTNTSSKSKYSPKLKNKIKVISKRHVKYMNYDRRLPHLSDTEKDCVSDEKSEAKGTTKMYPGISNESNNTSQPDKTTPPVCIPTSLSSKQTRLLMEQPFFKTPKYEHPTNNVEHGSKPKPRLVANNRDTAKGISSPDQPARELRLLIEQRCYKKSKSEPHTENAFGKNNLQKSNHFTEDVLQSSKTDNDWDAADKDQVSGISPRTQQSSIRSRLQRKIPLKAVVQRVMVKNTEEK